MPTAAHQQDLSGLVDSIRDLPSFPAAIQRATALAQDPSASAADLAEVIQVDPALTAKILRVTNSAFYGLSRAISTVKEGVVVLGFPAVRSLAVAVSAMKMFHGQDTAWFRHEDFWLHSTCCALVAQRISQLARLPGADEAFTAGLLHDTGKIILDQYAHDDFMLLLATQKQQGDLSIECERRLINTTHPELGQKLAHRWGLPAGLCQAIGQHHACGPQAERSPLAAVTAVADYLCARNGITSVVGAGLPPDPSDALAVTKVPPAAIRQAHREFEEVRREAQSLTASN